MNVFLGAVVLVVLLVAVNFLSSQLLTLFERFETEVASVRRELVGLRSQHSQLLTTLEAQRAQLAQWVVLQATTTTTTTAAAAAAATTKMSLTPSPTTVNHDDAREPRIAFIVPYIESQVDKVGAVRAVRVDLIDIYVCIYTPLSSRSSCSTRWQCGATLCRLTVATSACVVRAISFFITTVQPTR